MITSGGNRNPANPDLGTGTRAGQRRINPACPSRPSANATVPMDPPGLGRSRDIRWAGPTVAAGAGDALVGHAGRDLALASWPGRQKMDLSPPPRVSAGRGCGGRADRAPGSREPSRDTKESSGEMLKLGHHVDTCTGARHRHDPATVPARAGVGTPHPAATSANVSRVRTHPVPPSSSELHKHPRTMATPR